MSSPVLRLGRGPYFARVLLVAWAAAMVSHPPDQSLALYRVVGCEALPLVAGVYFAGLQTLITYWALLRLHDAGRSGWWALLTWTGALPGLLVAGGCPVTEAGQTFAYGFGILATLGVGALEPAAGAIPRMAVETLAGRYLRRLLLPVILTQVLVLSPRSDAATARQLIDDGMQIAPVLQRAVEGRWRHSGQLPDANFAVGLPPPEGLTGNAVARSGVGRGGVVFIVLDHPDLPCALRGLRIELVPEPQGERLAWRCTGALPAGILPRICRSASSG